MTRASTTATTMASAYSRMRDLRRGLAAISAPGEGAVVSGRVSVVLMERSALQDREKGLLRDLHPADLLHPTLAFLLLLQQLALARDVAAVALGGHVLAHRLDGLPGDHAAADRGL